MVVELPDEAHSEADVVDGAVSSFSEWTTQASPEECWVTLPTNLEAHVNAPPRARVYPELSEAAARKSSRNELLRRSISFARGSA